MAYVFSKRLKKSLGEQRIKVNIPMATRRRLLMLIKKCNEDYELFTNGYKDETDNLSQAEERFMYEHGLDFLSAFPENEQGAAERSDIRGVILRGNYPPYVLDIIELFYDEIYEEESSGRHNYFQKEVNSIFEESELPWRMANGKMFPVDSRYIEEIVMRKTQELLSEVEFMGALEEFEKARTDIANGEYSDAIYKANKAVESTMKGILGVDKKRPGALFKMIIESGYIPEYYTGFLKDFERNILRCTAIMRNEEKGAGHGQGPDKYQVPESLAVLGVHLSGVLIHYLIRQYSAKVELKKPKVADSSSVEDDDLPL